MAGSQSLINEQPGRNASKRDLVLDVAFQLLAEQSCDAVSMAQIARQSGLGKREVCILFPDRDALIRELLLAKVERQNELFLSRIALAKQLRQAKQALEKVGVGLVELALSQTTSVMNKVLTAVSQRQPYLEVLLFERGHAARRGWLASLLLRFHADVTPSPQDRLEASADRYMAMIMHLPSITGGLGMHQRWDTETIAQHVSCETEVFLGAHPEFSAT